jgi:hypothetical protein
MNSTALSSQQNSQRAAPTIILRNPLSLGNSDAKSARTAMLKISPMTDLTIDVVFDNKTPMVVLPGSASALDLPYIRKQALHEAITNNSAERKSVIAVELEFEGKTAIFEAVIDPNATKAIVHPTFLKSLEAERKN